MREKEKTLNEEISKNEESLRANDTLTTVKEELANKLATVIDQIAKKDEELVARDRDHRYV